MIFNYFGMNMGEIKKSSGYIRYSNRPFGPFWPPSKFKIFIYLKIDNESKRMIKEYMIKTDISTFCKQNSKLGK